MPPESRLQAVRLVQSKVAEAMTASVLRSLVLNIQVEPFQNGKLIQAHCWEAIILVDRNGQQNTEGYSYLPCVLPILKQMVMHLGGPRTTRNIAGDPGN